MAFLIGIYDNYEPSILSVEDEELRNLLVNDYVGHTFIKKEGVEIPEKYSKIYSRYRRQAKFNRISGTFLFKYPLAPVRLLIDGAMAVLCFIEYLKSDGMIYCQPLFTQFKYINIWCNSGDLYNSGDLLWKRFKRKRK